MSKRVGWSGAWVLAVVALSAAQPRHAQAGVGACGDIHVEAQAECTLVPPGVECEGMCKPVAVRAACAAQLAAECQGSCDDLPSVDCSGECQASCGADCSELEPGEFDCRGACEADCGGRCSASCEANSDRAGCEAACEGSCSASCEGSCDVELPKADCDASCEASCSGSCEADANFDCQLGCQAQGEAGCEAEVEGGCEVECQGQRGALFCDGQYVDHGGKLDECLDALRALVDVKVTAEASGEAGCTDGQGCSAEGSASAKVSSDCAVTALGGHRRAAGVMLLAYGCVLALGVWRRRGRKSRHPGAG